MKLAQILVLLFLLVSTLTACSDGGNSTVVVPDITKDYDHKASVMVYNFVSDVSQTDLEQFPHIKLETDPTLSDPSVWFNNLGPLSSAHTAVTWGGLDTDSIVYNVYDTDTNQLLYTETFVTQAESSYALFAFGDINGTIDLELIPLQNSEKVDSNMVGVRVFHAASTYPSNVDLYITTDQNTPVASNLTYGSINDRIDVPENIGSDYAIGGMYMMLPDFTDPGNNDISSIWPLSMHGGEMHFVIIYSTPANSVHVASVLDYKFP